MARLVALDEEIADLLREAKMLDLACARLDRPVDDPDETSLNTIALAAVCESVYSGTERALMLVAREMDGQAIEKSGAWHKALIDRMAAPFQDRQAVLSPETAALMDELRSFRHKVRSHYGSVLDTDRVREVALLAKRFSQAVTIDLAALGL